ncbi:MAG: hypothetical protein ABR968_02830 [Bacteroidales bacterium]|jgi:hypothetical protein
MYRKLFLIATFLLMIPCIRSSAQEEEQIKHPIASDDDNIIHRFFTGGTIGLELGTATAIEADPILGYKLYKDYVSVGIGGDYTYYRIKDYSVAPPQIYQTSLYGGNIFTRIYFLKNVIPSIKDFFIHGECQFLNVDPQYYDPYNFHNNKRYWISSVFGGIGVRQAIGERSSVTLSVLYDFNATPDSPYYINPLVFRLGLEIGL